MWIKNIKIISLSGEGVSTKFSFIIVLNFEQDFRRQVRSSIDSLISGKKSKEIRENTEDKRKVKFFLFKKSFM